MSEYEEVQAVLDVLFNEHNIRWDYELRMRNHTYHYYNSPPRWAAHFGRYPERMDTGWAKSEFDKNFREIARRALEQAARIRKERKKASDIFQPNAHLVPYNGNKMGIELYMGNAGNDFIENVGRYTSAGQWIRSNNFQKYAKQRGFPEDFHVDDIREMFADD